MLLSISVDPGKFPKFPVGAAGHFPSVGHGTTPGAKPIPQASEQGSLGDAV